MLLDSLSYLDLLHLLLVVDVHVLQGVLQVLVALQEGLPELCGQVKVWESPRGKSACQLANR